MLRLTLPFGLSALKSAVFVVLSELFKSVLVFLTSNLLSYEFKVICVQLSQIVNCIFPPLLSILAFPFIINGNADPFPLLYTTYQRIEQLFSLFT